MTHKLEWSDLATAARAMLSAGETRDTISRRLGVSRSSVDRFIKREGLLLPAGDKRPARQSPTQSIIARFHFLGLTGAQIARETGMSPQNVGYYLKKQGLTAARIRT